MTSREATIHNLKKLKGQPLKNKIAYILSNFWIPIVAVLGAVVFVVSMIVGWANQRPTVFNLCCINSNADPETVQGYLQEFAKAQEIDTEENYVLADMIYLGQGTDADYQSAQIFSAKMIAGDLDVMTAHYATLISHAYQEAFVDLRELLTPEQMETLAPYLLYMDRSRVEEMNTFSDEPRQIPSPSKPEEMEQPIPVAIILQPDWEFTKACYPLFCGEDAVAVMANSNNAANAQAFLQFVLGQKEN